MIRVLVCDDQEIVCQGLTTILNNDPALSVIATANDGGEALDLIEKDQPDLVLMDLKMPGMNGIQATQRIRQRFPQVQVLVLTTYDDDEWLFDAIRNGAAGYLLKDTPSAELIKAIKGTIAGETYVDPNLAGKLFANVRHTPQPKKQKDLQLSDRELEIIQLLARGLTNSDIARALFLSEGTVRNYTSTIFTKLGVSDRTQAVITALKYGLVDLDEV